MEATVDAVGRIVLPKALRDLLGLVPGSRVDVTQYGAGLTVVPHGRTAKVIEEDGVLVIAKGETVLTDEMMYRLIDSGRR
jgi:AbrB family looped-hinge helix DNA binding protein